MAHEAAERPGNRFLRTLPHALSERLRGKFETIALDRGTILTHAGAPAGELYFPDRGLISLVKIMRDGRTAEVGFAGVDGMAGVSALLGLDQSAFEAIVQIPGNGRRIRTSALRAEMEHSPALKELVLHYIVLRDEPAGADRGLQPPALAAAALLPLAADRA